MKIKPYLIFNGNAEEAANYYAQILGGKIENLCRFGDCMPEATEEQKNRIAHLCLMLGQESIGIADACCNPSTFGTGNIITIHCHSEEQINDVYEKLSADGTIRFPLQPTFFAKQYADFIDRYGVAWALIIE